MQDERVSPASRAREAVPSASVSQAVKPPAITLPKGGGAIRGIGEKFAANPVTGSGSMSIPIPLSPGRNGFGPQISLQYDSGAGNGPFGFGWSLLTPAITRKTEKGLPRYADGNESDVFILSGAEDLVPCLEADGTRFEDTTTVAGVTIHRYRPRVEGLFARIERWTDRATGEMSWRSITRTNITTLYGRNENSRIFDPADGTRIFSWLICESFDDRGNGILYEYAGEDDRNVDLSRPSESGRVRTANRYLKRILYGNKTSRLLAPDLSRAEWLFEAVFDYDENHYQEVPPDESLPPAAQHRLVRASAAAGSAWSVRPDVFSTYRSTFEVRTYRRCRRVLMFHRFAELGSQPCLVRATEFDYLDLELERPTPDRERAHSGSTRFGSFMKAVTQSGFTRHEAAVPVMGGGVTYTTYIAKSLPPVEFEYSKAAIQEEIRELPPGSAENLPIGLGGPDYRWVDLDGEGISGILTEQANAWFYKRNVGAGEFGPLETISAKPSLDLAGRWQHIDLAGDGRLDLVALDSATPGFFERTGTAGWEGFRPFEQLPTFSWQDPNLRFIDLDGDGHADVLLTNGDVFTWYPSLGEKGFAPAQEVWWPPDDEGGPRLVVADRSESIYLADMSGDGLSDLVRIRSGEVSYWPNLGYGRFGSRVTMENAPKFDLPGQFDQQRVRLADIDGSGTTDLIYLSGDGPRIYFNQCGNGWSDPRSLTRFPAIDTLSGVTAVDLFGNGTACLVWSTPLPDRASPSMRYIDLMGGSKPHLLIGSINNLGAETRIHYAASTEFYLADRRAGQPWITRLPFPVHVVVRIETIDRVSRNRFVTRYDYHHGHYDGEEREFRGFGLVEQRDTETFAILTGDGVLPATNVEAASHVPPILTKTWFHTGLYRGWEEVSRQFAADYYGAPARNAPNYEAAFQSFLDTLLSDTVIDPTIARGEEREACRALRGSMLRQETYALDGTMKEKAPYTVTEQNFLVRALQPRSTNRYGVFFSHPLETITWQYDREPADPRKAHVLTLDVDRYGNVLASAAISYGRERADPDLSAADQSMQARSFVTYTESRFTRDAGSDTDAIDARNDYRTPLPAETRTWELTGLPSPTGPVRRYTIEQVRNAGAAAVPLDYEKSPTAGVLQKRLIEHVRAYYRRNDLTAALPLGSLQSLALPFETYRLAFTSGLITSVHGSRVTNTMLGTEAGYVHTEGDANWWIPSGRLFYSPGPHDQPADELAHARAHFFLPCRYRDPFHADAASTETFVTYDPYDLLIHETRDPVGNRVTVGEREHALASGLVLPEKRGIDYRVLQPALIMDSNRNCSEVRFDALGMVAGTAVMGKPEDDPRPGDRLANFRTDLTEAEVDEFRSNPKGPISALLLGDATTRLIYDIRAYWRSTDPDHHPPVMAATLARETHAEDEGGRASRIQVTFSYSDGFGREIQKKIQAEAGPVPQRLANGTIAIRSDGQPEMTLVDVSPRGVGSGWVVFNNKGAPVRQYEPYFTDTHEFEFEVRAGVSPVLFYDPVDRIVATLHPDHTWEKVRYTPWRQDRWDRNDTILSDPATDADAGSFFVRLPASHYLPTWYALRTDAAEAVAFAKHYPDAADRKMETASALRSRVHGDTPTVSYADAIGHTFLTIVHNRFRYSNPGASVVEEFHATRVSVDIEGNERQIVDPGNRVVMRTDYDMLGNRIHYASMEAGERWMINDVALHPLYAWDSRGHRLRIAYDRLRRQTHTFVRTPAGAEITAERRTYGESFSGAETKNVRGKLVELRDQSGIVRTEAYDFKGNALRSGRRIATEYRTAVDWGTAVPLLGESFSSATSYDALNRPIQLVAPRSDVAGTTINVVQLTYNEANLLEQVRVWLNRYAEPAGQLDPATADLHAVRDIDYDANGQRTFIEYGNGVRTTYSYDPNTFRLRHLLTRRQATVFPDDCPEPAPAGWPGCAVQNLHYSCDPAGNVTAIRDAAQQTIYFGNRRVEPSSEYTYDASYRLIEATGREHVGQAGGPAISHAYNDARRSALQHPGDGNAMETYLERYVYDAVGNVLEMQHRGSGPHSAWTREFAYEEGSLLEGGRTSNRLTRSAIGPLVETYSAAGDGFDPHGNMRRMPHLQVMEWDFRDQLRMTQRQAVGAGDSEGVERAGERTWYVYDAGGRRVRKVTELASGAVKEERIYLDGFEIYRRHGGNALHRETLHVMDGTHRIAAVETRTLGNEAGVPARLTRYLLGNQRGSACVELDAEARIISYEEYTPFGSTSYRAARTRTEAPNRYRYSRKERDEENGFYYHGARYYAPWIARWTTCDPAGFGDGLNLYAALRNSPVTRHDPDGLQSVGELIEENAMKAAKEERHVALYLWSLADVTWGVFGAEGVSKVTAGTASKTDAASAAIEVASVIPFARAAKWGKGLFFAKEATEEAAPIVAKQITQEVAPVITKEATQEAAPVVAKEAGQELAPAVAKEAVPGAAVKQTATEAGSVVTKTAAEWDRLFVAADAALKKALNSKLPPVAASTLGKVGTASSRKSFRKAVTDVLTKDEKHPLRFLLGPNGKLRPSTAKGLTGDTLMNMPEIVEAGHAVSAKTLTGAAKGTDRFVVMSAHYNRMTISATIEHPSKGGSMVLNYALEIGGIPVHAQTARDWVAKGLLAPEVLENARLLTF